MVASQQLALEAASRRPSPLERPCWRAKAVGVISQFLTVSSHNFECALLPRANLLYFFCVCFAARVVTPPASQTQLGPTKATPTDGSVFRGPLQNMVVETQGLFTGRVAFVLGRRGQSYDESTANTTGINSSIQQNVPLRQRNALANFAKGGADVNVIQRMCGFEYLERYFHHVLRKKVIELGKADDLFPGDATKLPHVLKKNKPDLRGYTTTNVDGQALLRAIYFKATGKNAIEAAVFPKLASLEKSGIFLADDGPFLRGKTLERAIGKIGGSAHTPKNVAGSIGDDIAFSRLGQLIAAAGAMDWTPDGICHSKLSQGDTLLDEELDSRDGSLYNITIGGPAIATSWCGNKYGEVLPLDKLFVVIVADVWDGREIANNPWAAVAAANTYEQEKDAANTAARTTDQRKAYFDATDKKALITNMRLRLTTSSEMISHSALKPGKTNQTAGDVDPTSRMGLRLCGDGGVSEYIIGGWCMGTVLDSAASRASVDGNVMSGTVKRSRIDSAPNLNVKVEFWSADKMYRSFMNAHSSIQTRYSSRPAETALRLADPMLRAASLRP